MRIGLHFLRRASVALGLGCALLAGCTEPESAADVAGDTSGRGSPGGATAGGVRGITYWGYVVAATWVSNSGLIQSNGTKRPAMNWLMDYLGR